MALTLAITDNANGTGGVATISGSLGGNVALYRRTVAASSLSIPTQVSSRFGDGTITGLSALGYYSWYAIEAESITSNTVFQPMTANGDSIYDRCLVMLKDRIDGLQLTTIGGQAVGTYIRQLGSMADVSLPCILLMIADQIPELMGGGNMRDIYGYRIAGVIVESTAPESDENRDRYLMWHEKVHRRTDQQRWDLRVPELDRVEVQPGPIIASPKPEDGPLKKFGWIGWRCVARQVRNAA